MIKKAFTSFPGALDHQISPLFWTMYSFKCYSWDDNILNYWNEKNNSIHIIAYSCYSCLVRTHHVFPFSLNFQIGSLKHLPFCGCYITLYCVHPISGDPKNKIWLGRYLFALPARETYANSISESPLRKQILFVPPCWQNLSAMYSAFRPLPHYRSFKSYSLTCVIIISMFTHQPVGPPFLWWDYVQTCLILI